MAVSLSLLSYRCLAVALLAGLFLVCAGEAHASIVFRRASAGSANKTTSVSVAKPTGTSAGWVLVANVVLGYSGSPQTITAPSGWTAIRTVDSGSSLRQTTFFKVAGSSEPTSYTFRVASGQNDFAAGVAAYSGVSTTAPIDTSAGAGGASGIATAPSVTTAQDNETVIVASAFNGTTAVTPDPGTTERYEVGQKSTTTEGADFGQPTAGATGTSTITPTNTGFEWGAQTIVLEPTGTLSVAVTTNPSFSTTLNGLDLTASYSYPVTVVDTRDTGAGWNVQITSTRFTSAGGRTLPTTASQLAGVTSSCNGICMDPNSSIAYPVAIPSGAGPPTAVKYFNSAASSGMGSFTLTLNGQVSVPANSYADTYTATRTITIASGP